MTTPVLLLNRRDFNRTSFYGLTAFSLLGQLGCRPQARSHPWMYISAKPIDGLRSLPSLVEQLPVGHTRVLWDRLLKTAREDLSSPVITPGTKLPRRSAKSISDKNPDFEVCHAAGQRILRHSLVEMLIGEKGHKEAAMRQMVALFDRETWPMWLDQAHVSFGNPAGLRTGMLARDVGLAYDWLYQSLSESQRKTIVNGLDDQAIQPYLLSVKQDAWWLHDLNNWLTTIVGGLGIAGMALGEAHPDARQLVELAIPQFDRYMTIYGAQGEFNESAAYANSTERPVGFYGALRYASQGGEDKLASEVFTQAARWMQYMTLPPGRAVGFGDAHLYAAPWVRHFAAIAAATRDGITQWYYLKNVDDAADALEILWFDGSLPAQSPQGQLPLGRAFPEHGACVSSRTSWDPESTHCVVYGKASREEQHEHNDDGQVCIDGFGERLIVDLGSPSGYPADFFERERWKYYNASARGHNNLMIGGREFRTLFRERGTPRDPREKELHGHLIDSEFDDERGGYWRMDLSNAYEGVTSVKRIVIHALPGIVVVVDVAHLPKAESVSLRWHTVDKASPSRDGAFIVEGGPSKCYGRVSESTGIETRFARKEHRYEAPYDRDRTGTLLEQRSESYVEAECVAKSVRFLSLFSVEASGHNARNWLQASTNDWVIDTSSGIASVRITDDSVSVALDEAPMWSVALP